MTKRSKGRLLVARNIYFYRIEHFADVKKQLPGDIARIANLPFNEAGRNYIDRIEGDRLVLWPDTVEYPLRFRFGRTRLTNLPSIERMGNLRPLSLEHDEGLSEQCHIIIFEDGTVASEFNFEGPRISQLSNYLFVKRQSLNIKICFNPLLQHDILTVIDRLSGAAMMRVVGPPSAASQLKDADRSLGAAYAGLRDAGGSKIIDIAMFAGKSDQSKLLSLARRLVENIKISGRTDGTALKSLRIRGINSETGHAGLVDLLQDHLIASKYFPRESARNKAINQSDAYALIEEAYRDLLPDLSRAAMALPL